MNYTLIAKIGMPLLMGIGGILALWLSGKKKKLSAFCGYASVVAGLAAGIVSLFCGNASGTIIFFQIPILLLTAAGALHSPGYLKGHGEERAGFYWCFFNLTAAAMWCVTIAEQPLTFLLAWEVMGLASFALVAFDYAKDEIRSAAWLYLLACQAGAFALIMMFFLQLSASTVFVLGIIGFGLKIGFPILHVWLPEAHPAAPAPVSALMSGAMIQLGFYGLFRWTEVMTFGAGCTLLVLGLIGALGGIMLALSQRNLKKLLAYSSVENMGLLAIGFGLYVIGNVYAYPMVAACALCGTSLHMLNHACLKGGLFLGAGSILKGCHTLDIDSMGGLLKRMPKSGPFFILNACSLSGLPPFNGFLSEFLIYLSAIHAVMSGNKTIAIIGGTVLIVLALTGGIAAAVYAKSIGGVFLGEPRTKAATEASEVTRGMLLATIFLFCCSVVLIFLAPWLPMMKTIPAVSYILTKVVAFSATAFILFILLALVHFRKSNQARKSITWDCGYARPDARMEYTGTAFTQPLSDFFAPFLNFRKKYLQEGLLFPTKAKFESSANDPALYGIWIRFFNRMRTAADKIHFLQSGSLHFYILLMTIALILLLLRGLLLPWNGTFFKGGF